MNPLKNLKKYTCLIKTTVEYRAIIEAVSDEIANEIAENIHENDFLIEESDPNEITIKRISKNEPLGGEMPLIRQTEEGYKVIK